MNIQFEKPGDIDAVRDIYLAAFHTRAEADLVDALRQSGIPLISLVAHERGRIFGHLMFSPVTLDPEVPGMAIAGLAPMAVIPEHQNEGLGSMLVAQALNFCRAEGYHAVVVLGHPEFYPRFGFVPSVDFGIQWEHDVPESVFMIQELVPGTLAGHKGIIRYHRVFDSLS